MERSKREKRVPIMIKNNKRNHKLERERERERERDMISLKQPTALQAVWHFIF
jgi:hypothetical protein